MLRRVFLIRHCESDANSKQVAESRGDSALTELGLDQARRRAAALTAHELMEVTVVASPLVRAAVTARTIVEHHGWGEVSHDHRLIEGDLGELEGLTYREVLGRLPAGQSWVQAEQHGGESEDTVAGRMLGAISDALESAPGAVIVVTHGFAIAALMRKLGHEPGLVGNGDMLELDLEDGAVLHRLERHPLA